MDHTRTGLGPKEFGKMTGISDPTVYRLIKIGKIKAVRIGPRRLLIPIGEVERILQYGTEAR